MIKLILILIIIILLSLTLIKETFYDFVDSNHCNFVAWGPTKKKCINSCLYSTLKSDYDKNDKCDDSTCEDICNACVNKNLCQWVDIEKSSTNDDNNNEQITLDYTSENNKIKLSWNVENVENNESITKYLIHYRSKNGHPLHIIDNDTRTDKEFNIENNKYIPTEYLETDQSYEFIVYGLLDNSIFKSNKKDVHT
jgi:hypothetical protein